jgi:polyhydroxybutyrate depolymerase
LKSRWGSAHAELVEAWGGVLQRTVQALLLLSLLATVPARAVDVPAKPSIGCTLASVERGRRIEKTIDVAGTKRAFILDVPDGVKPGAPVPLLFDFHGFRHSGAGVWNVSKFRDIAARDPFVTVYPEGLPVKLGISGALWEGNGWEIGKIDGNRDLAFVKAVLDDLERNYCIDEARVFSTGFSNGGFFSSLLGCAMSDRFAAVAPVSGGPLNVKCVPPYGIPILIHHGRLDDLIPPLRAHQSRDDWIRINECQGSTRNGCESYAECRHGAAVEYCEGDYGHTWPADATDRIWRFFRDHPLRHAPP